MTVQERQAISRKTRVANGGRQISVFLSKSAATSLGRMVKAGESITAIVNRLLSQATP